MAAPSASIHVLAGPPTGVALLGYIEEMLLELGHMAAAGGEAALAATLAIAAIQCASELKAAERRAQPSTSRL